MPVIYNLFKSASFKGIEKAFFLDQSTINVLIYYWAHFVIITVAGHFEESVFLVGN